MSVALVTHPACLGHDPGLHHPEQTGRLRAVLAALEGAEFAALHRVPAPQATRAQLAAVHDAAYLDHVLALRPPTAGATVLDPDTILSPGSIAAALHAAGAAAASVDAVLGGAVDCAFAAIRPPGHHAEPARAMGFCLFNNVAIAAWQARNRWGRWRIAVADFDVHHGNGTEAAFAPDADLLFVSSHQAPFYPGTGAASMRGSAGNIVNMPLPAGTGSAGFRAAWTAIGLPAIAAFGPDLLIVSAGFDAHLADPLGGLRLETADFAWITGQLRALGGGRLVSVLEGGYDLPALADSVAAHVRVLLGD